MVWSDALLISRCPLIFPCFVCTLSWQARAPILQPEGRNKQESLGETARGGRGEKYKDGGGSEKSSFLLLKPEQAKLLTEIWEQKGKGL